MRLTLRGHVALFALALALGLALPIAPFCPFI